MYIVSVFFFMQNLSGLHYTLPLVPCRSILLIPARGGSIIVGHIQPDFHYGGVGWHSSEVSEQLAVASDRVHLAVVPRKFLLP